MIGAAPRDGGPIGPALATEPPASRNQWTLPFVVSAIALGLSIATLVIVLIASSGGGDDGDAQASSGSANPTEQTAKPTVPPASPSAPVAPTKAAPTPTVSASTPAEIPLPCNSILVPLDKQHVLARDCEPPDLEPLPPSASTNGTQRMRSEARAALLDMLAAAQGANLTMVVSSSYRSYDDQVATFNQNVASGGRDYAERTSAHAGHSEHQLGTTADMTSKSAGYQLEAFEGTAEAKWLAENSWKFGFIISYPAGTEAITGYAYEPWHIRYLGKDVAQQVKSSGLTLHQFLLK